MEHQGPGARGGPEGQRGKRWHPDDRVSQVVTSRPLESGAVCREPCIDRWLLSQEGDTGPRDYMRWPPAGGPGLGPGSGPQGTSANRELVLGLRGVPTGWRSQRRGLPVCTGLYPWDRWSPGLDSSLQSRGRPLKLQRGMGPLLHPQQFPPRRDGT